MRTGLNFLAILAISCGVLTAAPQSHAQDEATIEALKAQLRILSERIEKLESKNTAAVIDSRDKAPAAPASSWSDKIKLKGDFRYRHESFEIDDRRDQTRHRIRARTALTAQVSDTVEVGLGLASGGSDPISTNQTLGDGFSAKNVVLDLSYVKWAAPVEGMSVTAGKFKNPFHRAGGNGLIFDGDLNPEGVALQYATGGLFVNALGSWVDESASDDDSFLIGGQVGFGRGIGDGVIKAGMSYYHFVDARGEPAFYEGDWAGNRLDTDGSYVSGFELLEGFVEYQVLLGDRQLTLFADYVSNLEADDFDTGYALGAKLKSGAWQFGWTYQDLEADAVVGTFTDSDFIGGGTDGKGHILQTSYALSNNIAVSGTLFLNDRNVDFGVDEEFKRLMLDISFKY